MIAPFVLMQWHLPSHPQHMMLAGKLRDAFLSDPSLVAELDGPFAFNRYEEARVAIWANSPPMW